MEKISLLLLIAKKTLIGSVIAGILGLGQLSDFRKNNERNESSDRSLKENKCGLGAGSEKGPVRR